MNSNFQGTFYNLGERYTDFSKVLFLCFFYAALFPSAFIFGFAILLTQHYVSHRFTCLETFSCAFLGPSLCRFQVDKYCLMRIWGWTPTIGPQLAKFSRRYFFYGALLAFILVSAYAWAQFPYDNICKCCLFNMFGVLRIVLSFNLSTGDPDEPGSTDFARDYQNVELLDGTFRNVTVTQSEEVVFCQQSWRAASGLSFPPTERLQPEDEKWMTPSQETLTNVYGWTSLGVFVAFFVILFGSSIFDAFIAFFRQNYQPSGKVQRIDFSCNPEIFAYVPQIKLPSFPFPFLACDIDDIYQELVGWTDSAKSYDYYNLMFDVPYEGMRRTERMNSNTRGKGQISDNKSYKKSEVEGGVIVGENGVEVEESRRPIFSVIKHYPPPWLQKILDSQDLQNVPEETED